jgi:hypothetical protein
MSKITELFGYCTLDQGIDDKKWMDIVEYQICPYTGKKCFKTRKSTPDISIGTCTLIHSDENIIICPNRLLERKQVFMDCIHLLNHHEPGNELHIVPELTIPGGSVDFILASTKKGKVVDFVGIEFQTMDTTGTVWPERQRLLIELGILDNDPDADSKKSYGMNWKMTAKTILIQMHHKSQTFENLNKHLVLVIQKPFLNYMKSEFDFSHISKVSDSDAVQIHSYDLTLEGDEYKLNLFERLSTNSLGISKCLGLNATQNIGIGELCKAIESKISKATLLTIE